MCCDVFFCVVLCSDLLKNDGMKEGREFDGSLSFYFGLVVFSWQCFSFFPSSSFVLFLSLSSAVSVSSELVILLVFLLPLLC